MVIKYFEYTDQKSNKFWQITSNEDFSLTVHYGRIGKDGISKTFNFSNKQEQKKELDKKIEEKIKKGYVQKTKPKSKKTTVNETKAKVKKTTVKKTTVKKTPVKKILTKKKKDIYDDEWATTPDRYTLGVPSKAKLVKRKKIISEIYKMHKEIKKLDEDSIGAVNPEEWRTPPEYCDEDELNGMFLLLKEDLNNLTTSKKTTAKKTTTKKKTPKKTTPKKTTSKKTTAKKIPAKKTTPKKTTPKKTTPKKSTPKKTKKNPNLKKVINTSTKKTTNVCSVSGYKSVWDVKKQGVMLAHTYKDPKTGKVKTPPKNTSVAPEGWYLSEKFDGYRAIWNGKDFISRNGNIFAVPDWFRNWMPPAIAMDGELFVGREQFEKCGIFRKKVPDDNEWKKMNVKYQVFDCITIKAPFEERMKYLKKFVDERCKCDKKHLNIPNSIKCPIVFTKQIKIKNETEMYSKFNSLVKKGAEGVMLRAPNSPYEPKRSSYLLKVKQLFDAECRIIGYKPGTGKYKNMLGAFNCELVKNKKIKFSISGMDDSIRKNYKKTHPIGTIVTFTYMGLSEKNIPRHPVYLRIRK